MLKYPLFFLCYLIALAIVFAVIIILSVLMILKAILWDFKFEWPEKGEKPLTLIHMWGSLMSIPMSVWRDIKELFKI